MPIYEYLCGECAHTLDALQKLSDEQLVYCPQCGAAALKRQMSAPSFRLKGGGWYETDFKNDKRRNIADSDSKAPEAKADTKTEGKAEGKADKPDKAAGTGKAQADKPAAPAAKKDDGGTTAKKPDTGKAGGVA
ncbi:MAG TPA: zinc ribbon domain-containing protein [Gammaproteobacteria bacterium]|nr:zinc ribbon domain-containing protein [Gammaproteobacteria bacterium]